MSFTYDVLNVHTYVCSMLTCSFIYACFPYNILICMYMCESVCKNKLYSGHGIATYVQLVSLYINCRPLL